MAPGRYPGVPIFHSDSSFLCHRVGHLCSCLCLFCLRQSICSHLSSSTDMTAFSFYKLNLHLQMTFNIVKTYI